MAFKNDLKNVMQQDLEGIPLLSFMKNKTSFYSEYVVSFMKAVFNRFIEEVNFDQLETLTTEELGAYVEKYVFAYSNQTKARINRDELVQVSQSITNDIAGLGPLEILLAAEDINDIMVNAYDKVFVDRGGSIYLTDIQFRNESHVIQVAKRIAGMADRRIDEVSPMLDSRLNDGSRVNIIVPPVVLGAVTISIRRFRNETITLEKMKETENISEAMCEFLKLAAKCRANIIISGGTSTGKTTVLNALSQLIDHNERVITIEDSAELRLDHPHVIRLEARPPNVEGEGEVTIGELLRNTLRMRPDRIIVGEVRGLEVLDMLQAMNTGHDGSMSTLHANGTQEVITRIEGFLALHGSTMSSQFIKKYVSEGVDLIIQIYRSRDGRRRISKITELGGMVDGEIEFKDIFEFQLSEHTTGKVGDGVFKCLTSDINLLKKASFFGLEKEMLNILKVD